MKRYGVRYQRSGVYTSANLYVTRWGKIARWLRLPDRKAFKFTETHR